MSIINSKRYNDNSMIYKTGCNTTEMEIERELPMYYLIKSRTKPKEEKL